MEDKSILSQIQSCCKKSWRDSRASAPCGGSNPSKGKTKKRPFSRLYAELERFACILFSLAGDGKTLQRTIKNRKEMCLFPAELERFVCILFSSRGIGKQNRGIARCAHRTMNTPPACSITHSNLSIAKKQATLKGWLVFLAELERFELSRSF